jgi:hypothetical protein
MSASPSVIAAATTLAGWAREHRRVWSDVPLDIPAPVLREAEPPVVEPVQEIIEPLAAPIEIFEAAPIEIFEEVTPEPVTQVVEPVMFAMAAEQAGSEPIAAGPSLFERAAAVASVGRAIARAGGSVAFVILKGCFVVARTVGRGFGELFIALVGRLQTLREPAVRWLIRGAALVSTASVVGLIVINRGELLTRWDVSSRWDHVSSMVVAAANRPPVPPVPVLTLPKGVGRLTVTSGETEATVLIDGEAQGKTPLTLNLPAGAHRVLLRSPQGSVERAIRIQSGESSDLNEAIYPGWVALTSAVDVTLSEDGKPLKRDDRGWAILPPGPHDVHLDNRTLGVHEVRRVVILPGDTTRLSFAAHTSLLSLTTNEPAEIWIDGVSYGQTPIVEQPIPIGLHDVRIRSAAHERWVRVRATVQPVVVNVDLTAS